MAHLTHLAVLLPLFALSAAVEVEFAPYTIRTRANKPILDFYKDKDIFLTITVLSIAEKDGAGKDVPTATPPHKVMDLDTKDFIPYNTPQMVNASGDTPQHYQFLLRRTMTEINVNATLTLQVIISMGNGKFQGYNASDLLPAHFGTVLLRSSVSNWVFCDPIEAPCINSGGQYVTGRNLDLLFKFDTQDGKVFSGSQRIYDVISRGTKVDLNIKRWAATASGTKLTENMIDFDPRSGNMITIRFAPFSSAQSGEYRYAVMNFSSGGVLLQAQKASLFAMVALFTYCSVSLFS